MQLGEDFRTFQASTFVTPSCPEDTSGHSIFSAAAAEVLKRFKNSDALGFSVSFAPWGVSWEPPYGIEPRPTSTALEIERQFSRFTCRPTEYTRSGSQLVAQAANTSFLSSMPIEHPPQRVEGVRFVRDYFLNFAACSNIQRQASLVAPNSLKK